MDWIRLPVRIRDDPRVHDFAHRLRIPFAEALGRLVYAMAWAGDHETRLLPASLDGETRDAMRGAGLLGPSGLVDYDECAEALEISRANSRDRQRRHREFLRKPQILIGDGSVTSLTDGALRHRHSRREEKRLDLELDLEEPKAVQTPVRPRKSSARWRRVPEDQRAMTDEQRAYAARYAVPAEEWEAYIDWTFKDPKEDVSATWRTWVRRAAKSLPQKAPAARGAAYDIDATSKRLAEQEKVRKQVEAERKGRA